MTSENPAQVIFTSAHELTGETRAAFVEQACGHDPELHREVLRLLEQADRADSFFDLDADPTTPRGNSTSNLGEQPGEHIGPYILRQRIGEGGFGRVWMAEQSKPIARMVALKLIKVGMDTKQVLARFDAERQALALLDHPNIARVLDAGATSTGRPWFAMELVKGIPITRFCSERKYGGRERLKLFQDVCEAVSHAHQKGIIHRDLKPSNVMVTLHGDRPVVKVIDFGIAKATHTKLTDKTLFTYFEQMLGTPAYMSPEQAALSGLDIDTRSDIYSLGVLLYELLTGSPPFDPNSLVSAGYDEMRRIIREEEPLRPSTKLTMSQSAAGSSHDLPVSGSSLKGELDWIVMKAIEKDRARRYETANAFAADITRYLRDQPVLAVAPSAAYQFRKFARRHRGPLASALAVIVALIFGTVLSLQQMIQATKARDKETVARVELQGALKRAEEGESKARVEERKQRLTAYAADMNLVQAALTKQDFGPARRLLERYRPTAGEPGLRGWEWRYLWQLCRGQEEKALSFGEAWIQGMVVSPDRRWLAFRSVFPSSTKVFIWDLQLEKKVAELDLDGVPFAFVPNEAVLAFTDQKDTLTQARGARSVRFFDMATGKITGDLVLDSGCWDAWFTRDGKAFFSITRSGVLTKWDRITGQQSARFELDSRDDWLGNKLAVNETRNAAFTLPRGKANILEIDLESGTQIQWESTGTNALFAIALSPDGSRLATGEANQGSRIQIWDTKTRKLVGECRGHKAWISAVDFLPDGKTLASASADRTIRLWNVETMKEIRVFTGHSARIHCLKVASEGGILVSGSRDGTVRFWNPNRAPTDPTHRTMQIGQESGSSGAWFTRVVPWTFSADSQSILSWTVPPGMSSGMVGTFLRRNSRS